MPATSDERIGWLSSYASLRNPAKLFPMPRAIDAEPVSGYRRASGSMALPAKMLVDEGHGALNEEKFPTPMASRSGTSKKTLENVVEGKNQMTLDRYAKLFPIPTASDATLNAPTYASLLNKDMGTHEMEGDMWLNPDFPEWMMGWPLSWTSLSPMDRHVVDEWKKMVWNGSWWTTEPEGMARLKERDSETKVRLKAIGNGQVPLNLVVIWRLLEMGGCATDRNGKAKKNMRSRIMSAIKGERTGPEEALALALAERNINGFRQNDKMLPGSPDISFRASSVMVFVDGCFWHGCPEHYREPKSNIDYWRPKIQKNKERDNKIDMELEERGFKVLRFWEHEIKDDINEAINAIEKAIRSSK